MIVFYKMKKIVGWKKKILLFLWTDFVSKLLECVPTLKAEPKKRENRIAEYELQLIAHNDSGSYTCVVLNALSNWHRRKKYVKKMEKVLFL